MRIFNYRLSRARRFVESAFGLLAARWRVYQKPFEIPVSKVDKVVLATCVLHNFLKKPVGTGDTSSEFEGTLQNSFVSLHVYTWQAKREAFLLGMILRIILRHRLVKFHDSGITFKSKRVWMFCHCQ
jgi:hypothetical protein